MSDTKLTPAQKRVIREARNRKGVFLYARPGSQDLVSQRTANALQEAGLVDWFRAFPVNGVFHHGWALTPAGWAVEVGDE